MTVCDIQPRGIHVSVWYSGELLSNLYYTSSSYLYVIEHPLYVNGTHLENYTSIKDNQTTLPTAHFQRTISVYMQG